MSLTPRNIEALAAIKKYIIKHGSPPTYEQLGASMTPPLKSKNAVAKHVKALREAGELKTVKTGNKHGAAALVPIDLPEQDKPAVKVRPRGRQSLLTPELIDAVFDALTLGSPEAEIRKGSVVADTTWRNWKTQGNSDANAGIESIHSEFVAALEAGKAIGLRTNLERINNAAKTDWRAAAFIVERGHREHFGRNVDVTSNGNELQSNVTMVMVDNGRGIADHPAMKDGDE